MASLAQQPGEQVPTCFGAARSQCRSSSLRGSDGIIAVFSSNLTRAAQTAAIAFGQTAIPVLHDWRLRECDYGQCNGMPVAELHAARRGHLDRPYPGGESWRQAVARRPVPRRPATALERAAGPRHRSRRHPVGPGPLHRRCPARTTRRAGLRLAGRMGIPAQLAKVAPATPDDPLGITGHRSRLIGPLAVFVPIRPERFTAVGPS
jgi:Histidine phosphatase superfamily (branch 1)